MKTVLNRREFIGAVLPSVATVRKTGQMLRWAFYLFCGLLAFRLFAGEDLASWKALGGVMLKYLVPAVALITWVGWLSRSIKRHASPRFLACFRLVGRVGTAVLWMALGALLYDLWLRKPEEAIVGVVVFGTMAVVREFDERRKHDDAEANRGAEISF